MRLTVASPDPYAPAPILVEVAPGPDRTITVRGDLPGGPRRTRIRRIDAWTVEVATRIDDHARGVSYDVIRGPIDLGSPAGWRCTGWSWSAIVADAIAALARTVWGDA